MCNGLCESLGAPLQIEHPLAQRAWAWSRQAGGRHPQDMTTSVPAWCPLTIHCSLSSLGLENFACRFPHLRYTCTGKTRCRPPMLSGANKSHQPTIVSRVNLLESRKQPSIVCHRLYVSSLCFWTPLLAALLYASQTLPNYIVQSCVEASTLGSEPQWPGSSYWFHCCCWHSNLACMVPTQQGTPIRTRIWCRVRHSGRFSSPIDRLEQHSRGGQRLSQ